MAPNISHSAYLIPLYAEVGCISPPASAGVVYLTVVYEGPLLYLGTLTYDNINLARKDNNIRCLDNQ